MWFGADPSGDQQEKPVKGTLHWGKTKLGQEASKSIPAPAPAASNKSKMASSHPRGEFHTIRVGDTMFTVLKRYTDLQSIGSGAQGVVW